MNLQLQERQKQVLDVIKKGPVTPDEISNKTKLDMYYVKNILMEFHDALIVNKNDNNEYSIRKNPIKTYETDGPNLWEPVRLKNLSRIL